MAPAAADISSDISTISIFKPAINFETALKSLLFLDPLTISMTPARLINNFSSAASRNFLAGVWPRTASTSMVESITIIAFPCFFPPFINYLHGRHLFGPSILPHPECFRQDSPFYLFLYFILRLCRRNQLGHYTAIFFDNYHLFFKTDRVQILAQIITKIGYPKNTGCHVCTYIKISTF